jgi:hypothetical protein
MGAECEPEFAGLERELGQGHVAIPSFIETPGKVREKGVHGLPAGLPQVVDGNNIRPHEFVGILPGFGKDGIEDLIDPGPDLVSGESVKGIDRDDRPSSGCESRVEACRTIGAPQDPFCKIPLRKSKHLPVFLVGPPPGNDLVKGESHTGSFPKREICMEFPISQRPGL